MQRRFKFHQNTWSSILERPTLKHFLSENGSTSLCCTPGPHVVTITGSDFCCKIAPKNAEEEKRECCCCLAAGKEINMDVYVVCFVIYLTFWSH